MLDSEKNVYLIESNVNPDLDTSNPVLERLMPKMIHNLFKIALDPIFPPPFFPRNKK